MKKSVSWTIAKALKDAGVKVVTSVPANGVNEVFTDFNAISRQEHAVSFHEEPAYTIAHGASIAGTRAAVLTKSHGIIKAGNSLSDSLFCGTTAGMLAVVFADKAGKQSDSIIDTEAFLKGIGIPHQIADVENIYRQIFVLLEKSEKLCLPHALVVESSDITRLASHEEIKKTKPTTQKYQRDITRRVLCPFFVQYQRNVLDAKLAGKDFTQISKPLIPSIPDAIPDKWKHFVEAYSGIFSVFKKIRGSVVTGDTGISSLFACEPYNCIDITTYMGGSIPLAAGAYLGGFRDVWAVTGDFSFIAAGQLGLLEAVQRQIPLKILLLYNGKAATTGGQPIPDNALETVLSGYRQFVSYIKNPADKKEVATVLRQARDNKQLAIVVADYRKLFFKL